MRGRLHTSNGNPARDNFTNRRFRRRLQRTSVYRRCRCEFLSRAIDTHLEERIICARSVRALARQ